MFKPIDIRLTEPICGCERMDWIWGFTSDAGRVSIYVKCKLCGVRLETGKNLNATFTLDRPYPDRKKSPEKQSPPPPKRMRFGDHEFGKVIPFPLPEPREA